MTQTVLSVNDGPKVTVNTLVNQPLFIPARIIALLMGAFPEETLFRDAGANNSSLVQYEESTPLYLDTDVADLVEFEEIPVGAGQIGTPRVAVATKKGLGIRVSKEMRDENKIDQVNRQLQQLVNTMIRSRLLALRAVLMAADIPSVAASAAWDDPSGRPRKDIANAQEIIATAVPPSSQGEDFLGFNADTVAFSAATTPILMDNDNFLKVYGGNIADQNIAYTGKLEQQVMGLDPLQVLGFDPTRALVLERKTVGFYSDTRALQSTGLYPEGNGPNGGPTESWRSDTTAKRAMGVDQPLAACWITGITS
jgi:hypothetical protein